MVEYFGVLMELLGLDEEVDAYLEIAKAMKKNKDKTFEIYHRQSFLFEGFVKLLREEISLENFMQIGDVGHEALVWNPEKLDSYSFLEQAENLKDDVVYVVDVLSWGVFESKFDGVEVLLC